MSTQKRKRKRKRKKKNRPKSNVLFIRNGRKKKKKRKGKSRKNTKSSWLHFCPSPTIGVKMPFFFSSFQRGRLLWVWVENAWVFTQNFSLSLFTKQHPLLFSFIFSHFYLSSIIFYLQINTPLVILLWLRFYLTWNSKISWQ